MLVDNLPSITFGIPTYNEADRIEFCLQAIKDQNYPQSSIEVIIVDANSTDNTKFIANKYNCKIIQNEKKLPEPGLALAYEKAKGDYMVFMAADNIIFDKCWLLKMIEPFLGNENDVLVSFSKVCNDPRDNIWNKYMNEDQDPFSSFVFRNASHPDKFRLEYDEIKKNSNYIIYKYDEYNFPLIALAQGTILKTKLKRSATIYDDIAPIIEIIKSGKNIAYVTSTCLHHYSYKGLKHLYNKLNFRIYNSFKTSSYIDRENYSNRKRKIRRFLFIIYGITILLPILDGIKLAIQKKRIYMIIHPIIVSIITFLIFKNYIKINIYEKN
jgi:glycosyltransferase involved in cell wall biosynthesis